MRARFSRTKHNFVFRPNTQEVNLDAWILAQNDWLVFELDIRRTEVRDEAEMMEILHDEHELQEAIRLTQAL